MHQKTLPRVLVLLRQRVYGDYSGCKTGLLNSATFVHDWLEKIGVPVQMLVVVDGNSIDRAVHEFQPTHCIIEAIWPTPDKMRELTKLHPTVLFVVRVHSELGFLANEGMSIEWLRAYSDIPGVLVSFNSSHTRRDFAESEVVPYSAYLPNIYPAPRNPDWWFLLKKGVQKKLGIGGHYWCPASGRINVGLLGAIRPLKNGLQQAVAAIEVADRLDVRLNLHINSGRVEQRGEPNLKNIRALFAGTEHALVEHDWLGREEFLKLVSTMDAGLQVSFTESFSIVSADFVGQGVPVLGSPAVRWLPYASQASPIDGKDIANKLEQLLKYPGLFVGTQQNALIAHSRSAEREWRKFLEL